MAKSNRPKTTAAITEGAVLVAAALVLSFIKLKLWANGGSVDLVMIPLIIFALRRGTAWGVGAGLVFGTLKCIISGATAWGWASILLDYSVAYAAVGLAGIFKGKDSGLLWGTVTGSLARLAVHYISGVTIYAVSVAEPGELFNTAFTNPWIFSLVYNGSYMAVNMVLALVVLLPAKTVLRPYLNLSEHKK